MKKRLYFLVFLIMLNIVIAQLPDDFDLPPPPPTPGGSDDILDNPDDTTNTTEDNTNDGGSLGGLGGFNNNNDGQTDTTDDTSQDNQIQGLPADINLDFDLTQIIMFVSIGFNFFLLIIFLIVLFSTKKKLNKKIEELKKEIDDLKNTKPVVKEEKPKQELSQAGKYISDNLKKGIKYEDLESQLVSAGWTKDDVKAEYEKVKNGS